MNFSYLVDRVDTERGAQGTDLELPRHSAFFGFASRCETSIHAKSFFGNRTIQMGSRTSELIFDSDRF